jgi:hypothetical protein
MCQNPIFSSWFHTRRCAAFCWGIPLFDQSHGCWFFSLLVDNPFFAQAHSFLHFWTLLVCAIPINGHISHQSHWWYSNHRTEIFHTVKSRAYDFSGMHINLSHPYYIPFGFSMSRSYCILPYRVPSPSSIIQLWLRVGSQDFDPIGPWFPHFLERLPPIFWLQDLELLAGLVK